MKYLILTSFFIISVLNSFSQNNFSNPYSPDSITFNPITKRTDKAIPFDKPFILIVDKVDIKRIQAVDVFKTAYKKGHRYITGLGASPRNADLESLPTDTVNGKLLIFFPALKPNSNFDIVVSQSISDNTLTAFFKIINEISINDTTHGKNDYKQLHDALRDKVTHISSMHPGNFNEFKSNVYPTVQAYFTTAIDEHNFSICNGIQAVKLSHVAGELYKYNTDFLSLAQLNILNDTATIKSVSFGYTSFKNAPVTVAPSDLKARIANLSSSIDTLQKILNNLQGIETKTLDPIIEDVNAQLKTNISVLKGNLSKLTFSNDFIFKTLTNNVNSSYDNSETIWLIATTDFKDLQTKSAAVLSTDLGLTNIVIRDNENNIKNIPRLFFGVDIFFRGVDRNISTKYLPTKPSSSSDELSATKSVFHHLNLSVGLTLGGSINNSDFQNLYNNMSLTVGPSYRFGQAFRISGGVAVLKRQNPNPLLGEAKIAAGGYLSLSVDLAFAQVVKSFTDLIFK